MRLLGLVVALEIFRPLVRGWLKERGTRYVHAPAATRSLDSLLRRSWATYASGGDSPPPISAQATELFRAMAALSMYTRGRENDFDHVVIGVFESVLRIYEAWSRREAYAFALLDLMESVLYVTAPLPSGVGVTGETLAERAENDAIQSILRQATIGLLERAPRSKLDDGEASRRDARTIGRLLWRQLKARV